jgi:hypothetical protein
VSLKRRLAPAAVVILAMTAPSCSRPVVEGGAQPAASQLVGAWRSQVQFKGGPFASATDLEFMYVFNSGGTMTESSNYDGAPPVPPAYGVWRAVGPGEFEAHYEYYATRPPAGLADLTGGGGWLPSGRGVIVERIRMSAAGDSFTSTIRYEALDPAGRLAPGGGEAEGRAGRIGF